MTIEQRQHNVKLIADEGKGLTQKGEVENRLFVSSVYTKTPNLWEEWTNEQADEWIALHPQEEEPKTLAEDEGVIVIEPLAIDEL